MAAKSPKAQMTSNIVLGPAVSVPGGGGKEGDLPGGSSGGAGGTITARQAGGLRDMMLPVSPKAVPVARALQNMAKAINIAFTNDFLENELEDVYKGARVRKGAVVIHHADYMGLGDGIFATIGKVGKSIQLTLQGPDPASPQGKKLLAEGKGGFLKGLCSLIGRKLDMLQEYEDMVPTFVEQLLDRLEATNIVVGWDRDEWEFTTTTVGLDVHLTPRIEPPPTASKPKK